MNAIALAEDQAPARASELRAVIDNYRDRLAQEREQSLHAAAKEQRKEDRYFEVRATVIEPVMEEIRQVVQANGEDCEILLDDRHFPGTIVFALYPSGKPRESYTEENTPKMRFLPLDDYGKVAAQVVIDKLLVYGGNVGEWLTEKIAREDVESVLIRFVTDVFKA